MEEEGDDVDFIIEQFLENLNWSEEVDAKERKKEDEEVEVYLKEDLFLAQIYDFLIQKFMLCKNKPQEDSKSLAIEDLRSVGIIDLNEAKESQELKAMHDPDSFGILGYKDSNDLLLQIAAVEVEWNALTTIFFMQECKGAYKKFLEQ